MNTEPDFFTHITQMPQHHFTTNKKPYKSDSLGDVDGDGDGDGLGLGDGEGDWLLVPMASMLPANKCSSIAAVRNISPALLPRKVCRKERSIERAERLRKEVVRCTRETCTHKMEAHGMEMLEGKRHTGLE